MNDSVSVNISIIEQDIVRISCVSDTLSASLLPGAIYMVVPQPCAEQVAGIPCFASRDTDGARRPNLLAHAHEAAQRGYSIDTLCKTTRCDIWNSLSGALCDIWKPLSGGFDFAILHGTTLWYTTPHDAYLVTAVMNGAPDGIAPHPVIFSQQNTDDEVRDAIRAHTPHAVFISAIYASLVDDLTRQRNYDIDVYSMHALSTIICGTGACKCCVEIVDDTSYPICLHGPFIQRRSCG